MNQDEEAGKYLGEEEEVEEEPALCRGGGGREVAEQMLAVTLSLSHRVEHLTVAPVTPATVTTTQSNNYKHRLSINTIKTSNNSISSYNISSTY